MKKLNGFALAVSFTLVLPCALLAQSKQATLIDKVVHRCGYGQRDTPGLSVIVIRDGKVLGQRSYGLADMEKNIPVTALTNFRIASLSKQFTAMAIQILKERGKLSYDSRLAEFFPEFPEYGRNITIRQLLNHTSGLKNYENEIPSHQPVQITDADVLSILERQTSGYFAPGKGYQYSNSGYIILALIIEKVSGQTFARFLQENIFKPAGMSSSVVYTGSTQQIPHRAYGYTKGKDGYQRTDQSATSATYGDGGIYSSTTDMAKWDQVLYTSKLISSSAISEAFTPGSYGDGQHSDYGFGWSIDMVRGYRKISHEGATIGSRSYILRLPEQHFSVIVLMNVNDGDPGRVANGIARAYFPKLVAEQPVMAKVNQKALNNYTGFFEVRGGINYFTTTKEGLRWIGITSTPIDLLPQADGKFFYADADLNPEGNYRIAFLTDDKGQVSGFNFEVNGKPDFHGKFLCGPLNTSIKHQDNNIPSIHSITEILHAMAKSGEAMQKVTRVTSNLRKDLQNNPQQDLVNFKSLTYVSQVDITSSSVKRHGSNIARICFYKISWAREIQLLLIYLTDDGLVADEDIAAYPNHQ